MSLEKDYCVLKRIGVHECKNVKLKFKKNKKGREEKNAVTGRFFFEKVYEESPIVSALFFHCIGSFLTDCFVHALEAIWWSSMCMSVCTLCRSNRW